MVRRHPITTKISDHTCVYWWNICLEWSAPLLVTLCLIDSCYSLIQGNGNQHNHPSVDKGVLRQRIITSHNSGGLSLRERTITIHNPGGLSTPRENYYPSRPCGIITPWRGQSPVTNLREYHPEGGFTALATMWDYHSERGLSPVTTLIVCYTTILSVVTQPFVGRSVAWWH